VSALPALSHTVRVLPTEILNRGPIRYSGDLLGLLGQSGSEIAPTRAISRLPGAPLVPDRTVLVGDSYADAAWGEVTP
jgi:hypothetical protein